MTAAFHSHFELSKPISIISRLYGILYRERLAMSTAPFTPMWVSAPTKKIFSMPSAEKLPKDNRICCCDEVTAVECAMNSVELSNSVFRGSLSKDMSGNIFCFSYCEQISWKTNKTNNDLMLIASIVYVTYSLRTMSFIVVWKLLKKTRMSHTGWHVQAKFNAENGAK